MAKVVVMGTSYLPNILTNNNVWAINGRQGMPRLVVSIKCWEDGYQDLSPYQKFSPRNWEHSGNKSLDFSVPSWQNMQEPYAM